MTSSKRPSARSNRTKLPPPSVRIEGGALHLPGSGPRREVPLWSGAVHYFRAPRDTWRTLLESARDLGLTSIETYVPWQVHELSAGRFDFGTENPDLDVGAFIDLIGELGLYAIVRPGPHINSEMTYFGLPERIVFDRACQARSAKQAPVVLGFPPRMVPVPSYASETFFSEVERWYAAVGEVLASRVYPRGPIVLLQVDNEAAFYFRDSAYDQDYHPDAITLYRQWLADRYASEDELRRVHGKDALFATVEPPTAFDVCGPDDAGEAQKIPRHLDWGAFREALITTAIVRMKGQMERAGLGGVPTLHNLPLGELSAPVSLPGLEGVVDAVGLDYYHARREHETIKRRTLFLVGSSRFPISPEMGAGAPYWFTPLSHEDSIYCTEVALAYGLRGLNLYMAVDRDRWYGAPIDAEGNPRAVASEWRALFSALRRVSFHGLTRRVPVGIVVPREYLRLARASHVLGFISPIWLEAAGGTPVDAASDETLGMAAPIQVRFWELIERISRALEAAHVPFVLIDSEVAAERLEGIEALFCPSYEIASPERWRLLTGFAQGGGRVLFGPVTPSFDDRLHPRLFPMPEGAELFGEGDVAAAVAGLVHAHPSIVSAVRVAPSPCEVTVHVDAEGAARVLFLINPSEGPVEAKVTGLTLAPGALLREVVSGRFHALSGDRTSARIPLRPQSCVLLEVVVGDEGRAPSDDENDEAKEPEVPR